MGEVVFFPEVGEVEEEAGANAITLTTEGKLASEEINGFVLSLSFVVKFRIETLESVLVFDPKDPDRFKSHDTMKRAAEAFREKCVGKLASLLNEPAKAIKSEKEVI